MAGTIQMKLAEKVAQVYGFKMNHSFDGVKQPVDLVFASEYFEHFYNPVAHLDEVIKTLNPKALIVANSFTAKAIGHYLNYEHADQSVAGTKMARIFNKHLEQAGYSRVKTKMWNSRPTYWRRDD